MKFKTLDTLIVASLIIISLISNQFFGFIGVMPVDNFQHFDAGFRVFKGDLPFRDYYTVNGGVFLDLIQSMFYGLFGANWSAFVVHASVFNCLYALSIYFFLTLFKLNKFHCFLYSLSSCFLMYPASGTPQNDHHSIILSLIAIFLFIFAIHKEKMGYIIFVPILFLFSFFSKQVPASYYFLFLLFISFLHFFLFKDKKIFINLFLGILISGLLFIFFVTYNDLYISKIYEQYFVLAFNIGESRLSILNFEKLYDDLSKLFFLLFLLFPLLIFSKKNSIFFKNKLKKNFIKIILIIFFISNIFIAFLHESYTWNQPVFFALLPLLAGILHVVIGDKKIYFHKQELFLIILFSIYAVFRVLRFDFIYLYVFLLIITIGLFCFYNKKLKVHLLKISTYILIYTFFSSAIYFEKYVKNRAWNDLANADWSTSFKGELIDPKFNNLIWKTYIEDTNLEFSKITKTRDYIIKSETNFLIVTNYQVFNVLLGKTSASPVKFWYSSPLFEDQNNKSKKKFDNFFLKKLKENKIKKIIDINDTPFKLDNFIWLNKCSLKIENKELDIVNVAVYEIKENCL